MTELTVDITTNGHYSFSGALNMETVGQCWQERGKAFEEAKRQQDKALHLDLAKVDKVDTAGLAWLIHLTQECQSHEIALRLANTPANLLDLAKLSNVEHILPLK